MVGDPGKRNAVCGLGSLARTIPALRKETPTSTQQTSNNDIAQVREEIVDLRTELRTEIQNVAGLRFRMLHKYRTRLSSNWRRFKDLTTVAPHPPMMMTLELAMGWDVVCQPLFVDMTCIVLVYIVDL